LGPGARARGESGGQAAPIFRGESGGQAAPIFRGESGGQAAPILKKGGRGADILSMLLAMVTLAQLLHDCAPNVDPRTMTAIVRVESAGRTFALRDNTLGTVYYPPDNPTAVAWTNQLLRRGDNLDLGLSQINSANLARLGISVNEIFNPCVNLRAGSQILGEDYSSASSHFGSGQFALRRALGAYNSGSLYAGQGYVNAILAAAGLGPEQDYPVTAAAAPEPPTAKAPGKHRPHAAASSGPEPAYTLQHTSGSPVTVIVGS